MGKVAGWTKTARTLVSVIGDVDNEVTVYTYDDGTKRIEYFNGGYELKDAKGRTIEQDLGEA